MSAERDPLNSRPAGDADLGSLYPFIAAQASDAPRLSWLKGQFAELESLRRMGRRRLKDLLHYAPARCSPEPQILGREKRSGYTLERLTFRTAPGVRVPASLLIPDGARLPAPGVVALHDHGAFYLFGREKLLEIDAEPQALTEFRKQYYSGLSTAAEMARRGYVVIAIDMFYWGERRLLRPGDPESWTDRPASMSHEDVAAFNRRASQTEDLTARTIHAAGFTWPGVMLWDDLRTLDYLASRPEVDPKRLACVGLSVGGFRSCHLAAQDSRIRAAVIAGWMTSFPYQLRHRVINTIGHSMVVPGLYGDLDYPDVASLAMPSALLVINGSRDTLFEASGVQRAFDRLHASYAKAGVPDRIRTRLYDTPHEFNSEMQAEAWDWLKRWV